MSTDGSKDPQAIHRLAKLMLDRGSAASTAEAEAKLHGLRVQFQIDEEEAVAYEQQVTLLTAVALARRVFLGGVFVSGKLDVEVVVPLHAGKTLGEAVTELGATVGGVADDSALVYIGGPARPRSSGFAIRTACAGWRGGIAPAHSTDDVVGSGAMPFAAVLAAALAINETFLAVSGEMPAAGKRSVGLSLWAPEGDNWILDDGAPALSLLPSKLWLIGLGHLGQAYLWGLGMLPYRDPADLELLLQDLDRTTASTWSTSMLTPPPNGNEPTPIGVRKTRLMAQWAERRGFATTICERRFDANTRRLDHEPAVALSGVDNPAARRALDKVGFDFVVSAGLGSGHTDFRTMRIHTLPGERQADEIWPEIVVMPAGFPSAYDRMLESGELDECGAALLAGVAVGAPFVGAIAAALAISEVLRLLHGGAVNRLIDLDLSSLEHKIVLPQKRSFADLNTGFTSCA